MSPEAVVNSIIATAVVGVLGVIGWGLRNAFTDLKSTTLETRDDVKGIVATLSGHNTEIKVVTARLDTLENIRIVTIETELSALRQRAHDLTNEINAVRLLFSKARRR